MPDEIVPAVRRVDRRRGEPLHDQIAREIRSLIQSGAWPAHHRLPSEPALAEQLGVNRGTLRRAISTLAAERLLVSLHGRGTYVASGVVEPVLGQRFRSLSEDFRDQGIVSRTRVLSAAMERLPLPVQSLLDVPSGTPGLRLERVFDSAEGPMAYLVNYVRADLCPGIAEVDFTRRSLFDVLEHDYALAISEGRRTFGAEPARAEVGQRLHVAPDSPVLYLEQVTYLADGRPCECSDVWINSARIKVTAALRR